MRRGIALGIAVALTLGAVVLAVLPYTSSSEVEVPDAGNERPDEDGNYLNVFRITIVQGRCRPPLISAWRKDPPDDEGLWAVTVGTNKMGYSKADSLERLCARRARKRLLGSLGLGVLGSGAVLVGRRHPPPAARPGEPVPS